MPNRPGLDDDPYLEAVIGLWRQGSAEIDSRLAVVQQRMMTELARPTAPYVYGRLQAQQSRLFELQEQAAFVLDDALQQTAAYVQGERFAELYAAGALQAGLEFSWTAPHRAAVQALARDTYADVLQATVHMDDQAKGFVRRVGRAITTAKLVAGDTAVGAGRQLRRDLEREFRARGIGAITYRDGSRHSFGEYAEMLLRTKTGMAYNTGTLNTSRMAGIAIFEILDGSACGLTHHHDPELANGMIVDAATANAYPLSHPNCRRAFAPRPDLTSKDLSAPGADPSPKSRTTAPQRADQKAFEEALAAARGRRGGRSGRRQRRQRRQPARAGRPARTRRQARQEAAAENARRRRAIEKARLEARERVAEAFQAERARGTGGTASRAAADRWGVSPEQLREARPVAKQLKADIREVARREADELGGWLGENDLDVMARPERLKQATDVVSGRRRSVRTDTGYDFLEQLDDAAEARVRKRMTVGDDVADYRPDVLADKVRRVTNQDFSDDEAIDWLVERWLHEDGLRSVASGRVPKYADPGNLIPADYQMQGYRLNDLFGVDLDEAAGHVARVQADEAVEYAQRALRPSKLGPDPWTMDPGDYVAELEALEDAVRAVGTEGATPGPGHRDVVARVRELAPDVIDPEGSLNPFELHERIRLTAVKAGYLDPTGAAL